MRDSDCIVLFFMQVLSLLMEKGHLAKFIRILRFIRFIRILRNHLFKKKIDKRKGTTEIVM